MSVPVYRPLSDLINKVSVLQVELKFIVIPFTVVIYGGLAYSKVQVIFGGGVGKNGSTVAGTSVLSPIIPFSLVIVPAYIIYKKSENQLYENNPALYILAFGMVSAKVTNRLVVAHMTKNELDYLDTALVGPAMLFLNQYFNFFFNEYYVLWACLIWVTLDLLRYSTEICHEICDHLKIKLFRIPYPNIGVTGKPAPITRTPSNGQQQQPGNLRLRRQSRAKH
ncbi:Choline/ethanolaminephosphotransferase 1 [Polyplax serrata]|uniref:Choline/ethanolaminephosphotransferase 1 n=1 Tax=Polyplax serrata TaxID=468196 RepID=A0AAN8S064_POLSC